MFSTQKFLADLAQGRNKRVLYYPSAGERDGFVCDLNADILIFSDYRPKSMHARRMFWRRFRLGVTPPKIRLITATPIARVFRINQRKIGIFLFIDNNDAVEMIRKSGLKISTLFSKNDGCAEGGNYECVNEMPFFGKILDLMPDGGGMYCITDHNAFLFTGTYSGKPKSGDFKFVIGTTAYETSLVNDHENRSCEFIIRKKCQSAVEDTILCPRHR